VTNATIDAAEPGLLAGETAGPLEQRHLQYANYRAVADGSKVTRTHWHIALANGLGWGFDGMDGVIFGLISPLIIKEFALDIPTYRTGFQIWLTLGITGLYFWPWLSDRVGRRMLLAVNIAIFFADDADRGAVPELRFFCRSTRASNVCAQRGVVSGIDARRRDMARTSARPGHQHQPRHLVFRRLVSGCNHRARRRYLGVARGGDGSGSHRSARDLRPSDLS
jgi:hypothetical protein